MLAVYLFNLTGYNFLFRYYIHQSDKEISQRVDINDFSEASLVEVKVKLNLPYLTDWSDYQRYDGEMEVNGIHYNYVKRIVYNDTMYLYCITNQQRTEMSNARNEYARQATDIPVNKKADQSSLKKSSGFNEYSLGISFYDFSALMNTANRSPFFNNSKAVTEFISKPAQPPELIG